MTSVLVIPIDIKHDDIASILISTVEYVSKTIIIHLHTETSFEHNSLPNLSNLITKIYQESARILPEIDLKVHIRNLRNAKYLEELEVVKLILFGFKTTSQDVQNHYCKIYGCSKLIFVGTEFDKETDNSLTKKTQMYDTVVLGGTFDRLHVGHKILLTESIIRSRKKVVVGVTDENMVRKGKVLPELILPLQKRIQDVLQFLTFVDDSLVYEVVPISDPFGPTATDPNMELIVVSEETFKGGIKVNELRAKKGLNQLYIHKISLVDHFENVSLNKHLDLNEQKISSSRCRYELLGKYVKTNKTTKRIHKNLYIIGIIEKTNDGKHFQNAIKGKNVIVLQVGLDQPQKCEEYLHMISAKSKPDVIFLSFGTSTESELIDKCQEVWCCLSSEQFLTKRLLDITDIFFTLSLPLQPQLDKAWPGLLERFNN